GRRRRVRTTYGDGPEEALGRMGQAADGRQRARPAPAPAARLMAFGENGFELALRVWVVSPEQGVNNVRSEINLAIWRAFRAHGIAVPFPQREVRLLDGGRLDDARDRSPSP